MILLLESQELPTRDQLQKQAQNNLKVIARTYSSKSTREENFVIGDVEEVQLTLKFEHEETNGEGLIKVSQIAQNSAVHFKDFKRSMA